MRKIIAIVVAAAALVCLGIAGVAFAKGYAPLAPKAADAIVTPTPRFTPTPASTVAPGTEFTIDATLNDIPSWISDDEARIKVHTIHVWSATATCMKTAGYSDFHYKIFWILKGITPDSEKFWTDSLSAGDRQKALVAEFGPTMQQGRDDKGCYGRTAKALVHKYLFNG